VLGLLLLRPGRLVPAGTLVSDLWGDSPPGAAENSIQVHVSRLRRALPSDLLVTRTPGYLIDVEPEQVDAVRFERAALEARERFDAGELAEAAAAAAHALAEWRGPPLPGAGYHGEAAGELARLEELHLRTAELDADVRLALGRAAEVVGDLEALIAAQPLHEPFRRQLILALYRAGRQADALDAYTRARDDLVEQAGIDPSPDLQELQRRILLQDASLSAPVPPRPGAPALQPETMRKTVSAVYASVHGAEAPSDPELQVADLGALAAALERNGGTILEAPDGVVALFGVPQVREDDAVRAARGALACLEAVPGASIGIASGDTLVEAGGGPHGPVVRDAARLAHAAAPGHALLADSTALFLRDAAVTEPYTDRRGSLSAPRLVALVPDAEPIARRYDLPLVGRAHELLTLEGAFERAVHERRCHLLTLLGEAGIGKSRLAEELRSHVEGQAATLTGRCPADEATTPLQPLHELVRSAAGEVSVPALTELLAGEPDVAELAEALRSALGAGESDEPPELFWAFRRLFEILAGRRPTVVFLEDLHWADASLLDLVERLVGAVRNAPLLFVCLARPELLEHRSAWGGGKVSSTSLLLEPLTEDESLELIDLRRFGLELPAETRARIAERAEGNPLYIEQVLALLAEAPEAEPSIPPSVQALIEARLDALAADERRLLQHAAVAGREFGRAEVGLLLGSDPVDELVESLTRKELLATGGDGILRFRHATIRDVAYSTLPKRDRARLHAALADWLELERDGGVAADEAIAFHLEQAIALRRELSAAEQELRLLAERAGRRLASAGRRALGRGEARHATELLTRATEYGSDADVLLDLAEALRQVGSLEASSARADEAQAAALASGNDALEHKADLARLRIQLLTDLDLTSAEIVPVIEDAIASFERAGDDAGLALAWYLLGWVAWLGCRAEEALKALEPSIRHAEAAGSERSRGQALHLLVGAYLYGPVPAVRAIERCEAVMKRNAGERRIVASTARALAGLYALTGEFDRAHELIELDRATIDDLGLRFSAAAATELYGWVYYLEGKLDEATAEYRRGIESFREMGDRRASATLAAGLAQVLHAQGWIDEAATTAEEARDNAPPDDLHTQIQWRGPYAKSLAAQGKVEAAQRIAQEGVVLARTTDFTNVQAAALADLGETLRLAGDADRAEQVTRRALALYEKKGNTAGAAALRTGLEFPD
jgi:DNA-binding SARP family transcriptional activator